MGMGQVFKNNAATTLNGAITNSATSITVTSGAVFPAISGSQWFYATITQAGAETSWEIVKVTAVSGNTLTVVRGQQGTSGSAWANLDKIELRITASDAGLAQAAVEEFALTGDISPSQITADQNDYAPTGNATATVWRINSDASRTITGIAGGTDGRVLVLVNVGSFNLVLGNQNAGSTAGNRIVMASGVDLTITPNGMVTLLYDSTTSRWRCLDQSGLGTLTIPTKVQCLTDILAADTTTTTTMSSETPTVTQGKEIATVTITPTRIGSKIVVRGYARSYLSTTGNHVAALFKDGASTRVAHSSGTAVGGYYSCANQILYSLTTASLTPITFALRAGHAQAGTCSIYAGSGIEVEEWDSAASFTLVPSSVTVAPNDAQYLTLAASANLTNERVFTPGRGLAGVDSGAGSAYTLNEKMASTAIAAVSTLATTDGPLVLCTGTSYTLNLPTAVGNTGLWYHIVNSGASGTITVDPNSTETIGFLTTWELEKGDFVECYSDGSNWLVRSATYRMRTKLFTSNGTFRAPQGCTSVLAMVQAGGGGSGGCSNGAFNKGAGGGASGELRTAYITPVPGTDYTVTVGAGGTAGSTAGTDGGVGGGSSVGSLLVAGGGAGGTGATSTGAKAGGARTTTWGSGGGSTAFSNMFSWPCANSNAGGQGQDTGGSSAGDDCILSMYAVLTTATPLKNSGGGGVGGTAGGGGGASFWAAGGAGSTTNGTAGTANTGNGAGAGAGGSGVSRAGQIGGSGFVRITWYQ